MVAGSCLLFIKFLLINKEFICNINDIAEKYNYNRIDKKAILFQRRMKISCTIKKNIEL